MKKMNITAGFFIALLALPFISEGYFTTAQTATKLGDSAAMFTIEYAFGLENHDIYLPIATQRGLVQDIDDRKVGYEFTENGDQMRDGGTAAGLVLSSAPIVDGMYKIAKGTAQQMTLLVFLITNSDDLEEDYALQVTHLPYFVDRGGDEFQELELNPSELQYYVTEEIELNTGNFKD